MNDKELAIGDAAYVIRQQDREPVVIRAFYTNPSTGIRYAICARISMVYVAVDNLVRVDSEEHNEQG